MVDLTRPDRWVAAWLAQTWSRLKGPSKHPAVPRPVSATQVMIPTRHGNVSALIYRSAGREALSGDDHRRPPLHIHLHGGGMVGRAVREDEHICRYLASETGCIVLSLHYHAAPQVTYPVAEQETFDALRWALSAGNQYGWDRHRITVGGGGAGAKLAVNTAQQAYEEGHKLHGLITSYPVFDYTRSDRAADVDKPKYGARIFDFAINSYFPEPNTRTEALASPAFDLALMKKLPNTLIQVGTLDWLAEDGRALASRMSKARRPYTLTEYEAEGGFTVRGDSAVMTTAIRDQVNFILDLYA